MLINCTPHQLTLHTRGAVIILAPSGVCPRLTPMRTPCADTDGIETVRTTLGAVTGLPDMVEGTILIVSALVMSACPARIDLRSPGEPLRDAAGTIVGCKGLCA